MLHLQYICIQCITLHQMIHKVKNSEREKKSQSSYLKSLAPKRIISKMVIKIDKSKS